MRRKTLCLVSAGLIAFPAFVLAAEPKPDPSFMHGLGKTVGGVVLEFPKAVLQGTLDGPPVVGTVLGALGGLIRAAQTTFSGILEMGEGFDPWGTKRD